MRYGINAARLPLAEKAAARGAELSTVNCQPSTVERKHFGQILVAAAGERDEIELGLRVREQPGQGVRRLERGHDALQPRHLLERGDRLGVGDGLVYDTTLVAQPRMLRPRAGIVEP